MTEIYIISGFLGSGKTTFIQKLLKETLSGRKTVLIENDFGDVSVDAALLESGGIKVRELSSGCICCSLSGNFVKAVHEITERYAPDVMLIEPSGVGKLSDIEKPLEDDDIKKSASVEAKITVVDVGRCRMYLDNFGEFFENQIKNADVILLSRAVDFPGKTDGAKKLIKSLNPKAVIFTKPWASMDAGDILSAAKNANKGITADIGIHDGLAHPHDHGHCAHDMFDTVTIRTSAAFKKDELEALMSKAGQISKTILRAKGIVRGINGYLNMQYVPGDIKITYSDAKGDMICFIGKGLDRAELENIFSGK